MGDQRKYLTQTEVEKMIRAVPDDPQRLRNQALILIMYIHALRAAEASRLKWAAMDLENGTVHVSRVKRGTPTTHYLTERELRLLKRLKSSQEPAAHVFRSRKGGPITTRTIHRIIEEAGALAKLDVKAHPHMLRHGAGYHLANNGTDTRSLQDYMGHRTIQHTVRYTSMAPERFKNFWPG